MDNNVSKDSNDSFYDYLKNYFKNYWKDLYALISFLLLIILLKSNLHINLHINPDNGATLTIINLLVQSEAAVIAIVITLSLVAVQLVASSYSTRVTDIFKKSHSFWAVVLLYISAIVVGLITLIFIDNGIIIQELILIDYYLGALAFITLIPFIWITFDLLKLSTVINKLSQDINKDNILSHLNGKNKDPIQPIIDIINSSVTKYDHRTLKDGLYSLEARYDLILANDEINGEQKNKIAENILEYLRRIGYLAINNKDIDSSKEISIQILKMSYWAIKTKNNKLILKIVNAFTEMCDLAIEQRLSITARDISFCLGKLGKDLIEIKFDEKLSIVISILENIGKKSIDQKLDVSGAGVATSFRKIGESALKHEKSAILMRIIVLLNNMGKDAILGELNTTVREIAVSLRDIGIVILDTKIDMNMFILATICKLLELVIDSKSNLDALIFKYYMDVSIIAINKGLDQETVCIFESILEIRKNALKQKSETVILLTYSYLGKIVQAGIVHGNPKAIDSALEELMNVAKNSKNADFLTKQTLIISLKEIVDLMVLLRQITHKKLLDGLINEINEAIDNLN